MVRVRIAPSPTGIPHIGNTRTALFNFLFARHNNGEFLLRIEDTDQARFVPESEKAIYEILEWLGLKWDGKVIKQSQRLEIYKEHAEQLLAKGLAYKEESAIRFKMPKEGETSWDDLIGNKHISFKNENQEDFIIIKSDGYPTYNFANVVDDHLMEISHVIRGEEFISSTPKHIQLYIAFGWKPPFFAHLPIVLGPDKTKLSKRHGAESILDYRKKGYLQEALLNYMALLGWRPAGFIDQQIADEEGTPHIVPKKERETLRLNFMIHSFELKDVNTSNPIFDVKKLEWFNGAWMRIIANEDREDFKSRIIKFIGEGYSPELVDETIPLVQERMKTLADFLPLCEFFFRAPKTYELDLSEAKKVLKATYKSLQMIDWRTNYIGNCLQTVSENLKMRIGEVSMLLRVAITGKKISPPLNESMEILGKDKVLARLAGALAKAGKT